jgi:trk system potassium uptake protein TrkH
MNLDLRIIIRNLGLVLLVLSGVIGLVAVFALGDRWLGYSGDESELGALLVSALVGVGAGVVLVALGRKGPKLIGQREALLLVAASWILGGVLAALPFSLWSSWRAGADANPHAFDSFVNCYFETISGLTTTGATIVETLASVPRSLLLWRSVTQWLGGLGIVVLFVAVLPELGVGGRRLFRRETSGPSKEGVTPRIQDTARALWMIYSALTVLEIGLLRLSGMSWFDSACHTFATLATGGFSTLDSSIAGFASSAIHIVIIAFMILGGINFDLYHQLWLGRWRSVFRDPELRAYLGIIVAATVIVSVSLLRHRPIDPASGQAVPFTAITLRDSLFTVVSIKTTTGFCTADFDTWTVAAKATLVVVMFIGGSAGSTSGGLKVVRLLTAVKVLLAELEHIYRPNVVRTVKIARTAIDPELKLATLVFLVGFIGVLVIGTTSLMLLEAPGDIDITSATTATLASLCTTGPGLARVGATQNYAWLTDASKLVLTIVMIVGRLEMFTIVALFTPRFWRSE